MIFKSMDFYIVSAV